MKKLRLLKSEDVKEHLKGILPLADCLALQKAVTRLPKASRSRQHGLLTNYRDYFTTQ